jgi:hypothetical protein
MGAVMRISLLATLVASLSIGVGTSPARDSIVEPLPPRLVWFENADIVESSGLAWGGPSDPDVVWTHNDSGDGPRLFASDTSGRHLATVELPGTTAIDWEDLAAFSQNGRRYLLVADTGDNALVRPYVSLLVLRPPPLGRFQEWSVPLALTIDVTFPDRPRDCEAVAVDVANEQIYLLSKEIPCGVFTTPLPDARDGRVVRAEAREIAQLDLPWITAFDFSPDGTRALALGYKSAFLFHRHPNQSWAEALHHPVRREVPWGPQKEAACFGKDGRLYVSSEGSPAPLFCLR